MHARKQKSKYIKREIKMKKKNKNSHTTKVKNAFMITVHIKRNFYAALCS